MTNITAEELMNPVFLHKNGIDDIADDIAAGENSAVRRRSPDDNKLLSALYASYRRLTGKGGGFERLAEEHAETGDAVIIAAADLYIFYENKYASRHKQGGRGSHSMRAVTAQNTFASGDKAAGELGYGFSLLYSEKQFKIEFTTPRAAQRGPSFRAFILNTCVAFMTPPETLDELLRHYGFPCLHVKNVHQLAVYAVLKRAQSMSNAELERFDPFDEVETLFFEARDILNSGSEEEISGGSDYRLAFTSTNLIRESLLRGALDENTMLRFVEANKALFNMRHGLLLRDFWKYSRLYTHVYYDYGHADPDGGDWYNGEKAYSLYEFMRKFCLSDSAPDEKHFNEMLFYQIENNHRHPTRELMIILWLFNLCFSGTDRLSISATSVRSLAAKYGMKIGDGVRRDYEAEAERVKACYNGGDFNISRFIFNETATGFFDGAKLVGVIRDKLAEYGWGTLDKRRAFDYYIMSVETLKMGRRGDKVGIFYKDIFVSWEPRENVPDALVMLTELFGAVKRIKESGTGKDYYPLECRLYEQL